MHQVLHSVAGLELPRTGSIVQAKQDDKPAIALLNIHGTEMFTYVPRDKDQNVHCSPFGNYSNAIHRMDTLWYLHIQEYYVAMRMNHLQPV